MPKFMARCENQVLTMIPNRKTVQDGIVVPVPGKRIVFVGGVYQTEDTKEVEFIRKHRLYGVSISETEAPKRKHRRGGEDEIPATDL